MLQSGRRRVERKTVIKSTSCSLSLCQSLDHQRVGASEASHQINSVPICVNMCQYVPIYYNQAVLVAERRW